MTRWVMSLPAVLVVALVLRLVFWMGAGWDPPLVGDEVEYQTLAENLVSGRGYVERVQYFPDEDTYAWQPPFFSLTLAALYALTGVSPPAARAFLVIVGLVTVWLVWGLGRTVFPDRPRVAPVAALLVACYPSLITHTHLLLSETVFTCVLVLAIRLLLSTQTATGRREIWTVAGAGVAFGLAALTRGAILYFAPLAAAWLAWPTRPWWRPDLRGVLRAATFVGVVLLTLSPWVIRNVLTFDQVVLLETKGGVIAWMANNPYGRDVPVRRINDVAVRETPLRALPTGEVERNQAAYAMALRHMAEEPGLLLQRAIGRFTVYWGFDRKTADVAATTRLNARGGWHVPTTAAMHLASAVSVAAVALAALVGFGYAPDTRAKMLLAALIAYFTVVHMVVHAEARYRLPLVPILAVYGAWALVAWRTIPGRLVSVRGLFVGAGAVGLLTIWIREIIGAIRILIS